jgi:uroporphyrinogen decarboxylase
MTIKKSSIKYKDAWGNVWETPEDGMVGVVTGHALCDLSEVDSLNIPDPEFTNGKLPWFWEEKKKTLLYMKEKEELTACHLSHGHTFLLLQDLLGYEKLIYAMADDDPNLWKLIKKVESFQISLIERFCSVKPDMIGIPEDLGMQNSPMISPAQFVKYIKPVYLKMTTMAKDQGICVHEHSDGYIMDLIDDLVECGGDVLNLQDFVNGIDNIEKHVKGRVVIDLDIDRQNITVFGTPKDIDDHIKECVMKLGSPKGGLTMIYQPWKPTPLENLRAVYDSLKKYSTFWS